MLELIVIVLLGYESMAAEAIFCPNAKFLVVALPLLALAHISSLSTTVKAMLKRHAGAKKTKQLNEISLRE